MLHTTRTLLTAALLCLASACGKSAGGQPNNPNDTGTVGETRSAKALEGSVKGFIVNAESGAFMQVDVSGGMGGVVQPATLLILSETPDACADLTSNAVAANSDMLALVLYNVDATMNLLPASGGTYAAPTPTGNTVPAGMYSDGGLSHFGAECEPAWSDESDEGLVTGGQVLLETIDASTATGTVDLTFKDDHLKGAFRATPCPKFAAMMMGTGGPVPAATCRKK